MKTRKLRVKVKLYRKCPRHWCNDMMENRGKVIEVEEWINGREPIYVLKKALKNGNTRWSFMLPKDIKIIGKAE